MARPVTFTEIDSTPDIISTNRHKLVFPDIDGVDGYTLALHSVGINIPAYALSQISVKYLGNTTIFAGGSASEHVLSVDMLENSDGVVLQSLRKWMSIIRSNKDGSGGYKQEYAKDALLFVFDSTGNVTHSFTLINVWPFSIGHPQLGQDSAPFQLSVQFSVDAVDLDNSYAYPSTGNTASSNTYGNPYSVSNFASQSPVFNLSNGSIVNLGSSPGGLSLNGSASFGGLLDFSGGVSLGSNGLNIGGSVSLGAFNMNFGSLFSF